MEIPLPEVIDRISILRLKIERVGEPQLDQQMKEFERALEEFERNGATVKKSWVDELYEINKGIWDLEWDVRKIVNSGDVWKEAENKIGFEELGRRSLEVEGLMKRRIMVKNRISEETGSGFKEIKVDHCGEED